ncbi:helix-turn-helix domain-containing protein [Kribbella albertanoniae]|uniref:Transcriptional regulator n=1 Tax=Kribbella albertanoniae TaxID=1266829 RepID=A0A4R4PMD8_9ACTN|nr:helix-turn-helix domain-containing protein [Kribbella albertanoniae]TDC23282.1 transcriptional regulator [Kribbella albertanoniae]
MTFYADCQARVAVELISGRWPMVVLYALSHGPARPVDLRRQIGGISQKVLTETLRRLETNGLVERHRYAEAPPRVEYSLTPAGHDLLIPINALGDWAARHANAVLAAQDAAGA